MSDEEFGGVGRERLRGVLQGLLSNVDLSSFTFKQLLKKVGEATGVAMKPYKTEVSAMVQDLLSVSQPDGGAAAREEDDAPKPRATKTKRKKRTKLQSASSKPRGFAKPVRISPKLAKFLGLDWDKDTKAARTDVVKTISAYVKENDLQDPSDRRTIVCDYELRELLGVDKCTFFSINKYLSQHFERTAKVNKDKKKKKGDKQQSAFMKPHALSDELAALVHTIDASDADGLVKPQRDMNGRWMLSRPQAVKHIWVYIKKHGLQDAKDKRIIVPDDRLRAVLQQDRIHMMTMNKVLSTHLSAPAVAAVVVDGGGKE